jgi:multiple antibiotic resistance protein
MFERIILSFIPVFVAVDALGVLPIYISLTYGTEKKERIKIVIWSVITAALLAVAFIFLGKFVFKVMGITINDFMIAGGAILFCISIRDILSNEKMKRIPGEELAIVPLGTPLIAGPALLTTSLIVIEEYGVIPSIISVFANIVIAGVIFYLSDIIIKIIGKSGTKAMSKITSLLLAAISIMMMRKGIVSIIDQIK